ncbi:MAG: hypothetical protein WBD31_07045 [Rubripirellula sp.]
MMTTQDIEQRFSSPEFTEAALVLDMIQRTPQQHSQYETRLKAQRDERARVQYAVEQTRLEGEVTGRIRMLRELLHIEPVALDGLAMNQLAAIENAHQRQLRDRGA